MRLYWVFLTDLFLRHIVLVAVIVLGIVAVKIFDKMTKSKKGTFLFLKTLIFGTFSWGLNGSIIASLVSALYLMVWAVYVFRDAILPALILGFIQTLWFYWTRKNWSSKRHFIGASLCSGILSGLLCFPPAFIQSEMTHPWSGVLIFLAAAVIGGAFAGFRNKSVLLPVLEFGEQTHWKRIIPSAIVILLILASFDLFFFGEKFWAKLPVTPLESPDVLNLPAGNAQGTVDSGFFRLTEKTTKTDHGVTGGNQSVVLFVQKDGCLTYKTSFGPDCAGGLGQNGDFVVGSESDNEGWLMRVKVEGKFTGPDTLTYKIHSTVITQKPRLSIRSQFVEGTGRRLTGGITMKAFNEEQNDMAKQGHRWKQMGSNGQWQMTRLGEPMTSASGK